MPLMVIGTHTLTLTHTFTPKRTKAKFQLREFVGVYKFINNFRLNYMLSRNT